MNRVVAAVVERDGRVLIARRPTAKHHGGRWEFPGGKIEEGESLLGAARRELREELDVEVLDVRPAKYIREDITSGFVIEFAPTIIHGEPRALEHDELVWVEHSALLNYDLAPS